MSPLRTPDKGRASQQSLLKVSPDSSLYLREAHSQSEYLPVDAGFSPGKPSEVAKSSALATSASECTKRQPVLLLVEDNRINLKVCLEHEKHWKFLFQSLLASGLMMAQLLETFAKKNNYKYDSAVNGSLALQAFQNTPNLYDIIFMGKQTVSLNSASS